MTEPRRRREPIDWVALSMFILVLGFSLSLMRSCWVPKNYIELCQDACENTGVQSVTTLRCDCLPRRATP